MKNSDIHIDFASLQGSFSSLLKSIRAYRAIIFFLFVAALYGFIIWRINVYSNAPADQNLETSQLTSQPHIDQSTVQKMLDLQNNSVSVQALFNQARQNPFQE